MNDWGVIGHDWAVRRLASAIANNALAQSHLITGPPGIGKARLALATAVALLGADARKRKLAEAVKHPDLTWLEPEEGSIKVEAAREWLRVLTLAPVESAHRVAVIDQADLLTDNAKNALLKTLEEPNPRVVIMLTAPSVDAVLPTIASRCQITNLRPAPFAAIRDALIARGQSPERATELARLARGRPGWALRALADEALLETRRERRDALLELFSGDSTARFVFAEKLAKRDGDEIRAMLDEWLLFWRDIGQVAGGSQPSGLRNSDQGARLVAIAGAISAADVRDQMRAVDRAARLLDMNVNARLVLDNLLLTLPAAR